MMSTSSEIQLALRPGTDVIGAAEATPKSILFHSPTQPHSAHCLMTHTPPYHPRLLEDQPSHQLPPRTPEPHYLINIQTRVAPDPMLHEPHV